MNSKSNKKKKNREQSCPELSVVEGKTIETESDDYRHLLEVIDFGNFKKLQNLLENWEKNDPSLLGDAISRALFELKLQNIPQSDEVEYLLEKTLQNYRLASENVFNDVEFTDIKDRILLVKETTSEISQLYLSNDEDELLVFSLSFIAKQIYVLKRLLKSTYDRLPWEEIEFCLIAFVSSFGTNDEFNVFSKATLNRRTTMKHLETFVSRLMDVKDNISHKELSELSKLPNTKRYDVIESIKKTFPEFDNLYRDYEQIRDVHSLNIIWQYSKLASKVNAMEKKGQFVILRTLQMMGEHLKNTLESPKISEDVCNQLVISLNDNSRKIVMSLRNSLSHGNSFLKRMQLLDSADADFFGGIQNDIKKIGGIIENLLFNKKIHLIKTLAKQFLDSDDLEEMKEISSTFKYMNIHSMIQNLDSLGTGGGSDKFEKIRQLVNKLNEQLPIKSSDLEKHFNKIDDILNGPKVQPNFMNYAMGLSGFIGLHHKFQLFLKNEKNKKNVLRCLKFAIKQSLNYFTSGTDSRRMNELFLSIMIIYQNIGTENTEIGNLMFAIINGAKFETDDITWVEKFERKLDKKKIAFIIQPKEDETRSSTKIDYRGQLDLKFKELKIFFSTNTNIGVSTYTNFKKDKILQVAVEALLLDIYSIMDILKKSDKTSNLFFLDSPYPINTGKNLRNHLAHYNVLNEILFNPTLATFISVEKFIEQGYGINSNIHNDRKFSYFELKGQYNEGITIITRKQDMFSQLQKGDFEKFMALVNQGANIKSRDISMSSCMHFASGNCNNLSSLKYLHNKGLDFRVKNLSSETPLHVAASVGNIQGVKYIMNLKNNTAGDKDNFWRTPLHRAAYNGHKEVIGLLMNQEAGLYRQDFNGFTALHCAVLSGNEAAVKVFFTGKIDRKIYTGQGGCTILHVASENGFLDIVKFLLRQKTDVAAKSDSGANAIHLAAFNGHLEVVDVLINAGADVNCRTCLGLTPLHLAAEKGFESVVAALLKHGADVDPKDHEFHYTPLHYATEDGYLQVVQTLLPYNADVNAAANNGTTPLHFAVKGSYLKIVEVLLKHPGINLNSEDVRGFTPLHIAADNGDVDIGNLLIKNGAKFNHKSKIETPLHLAASAGQRDFVAMLLNIGTSLNERNSSGFLPIHSAAESGNSEIINMLLKKGANINSETYDGLNCLHISVRNGKNIVNFLVNNGIKINLKNKKQRFTPLHEAVLGNYPDLVRSLIEAGADLNSQVNGGNTVIHMAALNGFTEIVNILLDKKASINILNDDGKTPLHYAIHQNRTEMVKVLISQKSIDLNCSQYLEIAAGRGNVSIVEMLISHPNTSKSNMSKALLFASSLGYTQVVDLLIQKGARPNSRNEFNIPSLLVAVSKGYDHIVETLLASGADIDCCDGEGFTALHIAAKNGNTKIVQLLVDQGAKLDTLDKKNRLAIELAAAGGHIVIFKLLFERGLFDVNRRGNDDFTFMHIAAQFGNSEIIDYLITRGGNVDLFNNGGSKAIHLAARDGFTETVKLFLDKGMNIDSRGANGNSLLHYAAYGGQINVMKFLLDQKIEVNWINIMGKSALHLACCCSQRDSVMFLLNNGAIFNTQDVYGKTPKATCNDVKIIEMLVSVERLFSSIKSNSIEKIIEFVQRGVMLNAIDTQKGTPLHFAVYKGLDRVVEILLENGASPNLVFKNGWTPLHYAAKYDHFEIALLLLSHGSKFDILSANGKAPIDFSKNGSTKNLLKFIEDSFSSIETGDKGIVYRLDKVKDTKTIRAVMNAKNVEDNNLITFAIKKNFMKIKQLKCISQPNIENQLDFADILSMQEKYQQALEIYKESYEKRRHILGNDNPATLDIETKIADIYYKQQKYQESYNTYEKIYQKQVRTLGNDKGPTLSIRSKMALVLHRQGKNEEALTIFQEVHEGQRKVLKTNDTDLLSTKCHMALVLNNLSRFEEALKLNREALKLQIKKFGPLDPVTFSTKNNIAMVLFHQGKHDEAVEIYEEVYEARKMILGPFHSDTMRCLHNKIRVLRVQKKDEEALKNLEQLYTQQKHHLGLQHRDTLDTGMSIADILFKQANHISAYKILQEIRDNLMRILPPEHPDVLIVQEQMRAISEMSEKSGHTFRDMSSFLDNLQISMNKAAKEGDQKTIEGLLKSGVDINKKDIDGRTALHFAIDSCDPQFINYLLSNGAEITETTNKGNSVLHIACTKGSIEIVDILLSHVKVEHFHRFINIQTSSGKVTALHVAAKKNHVNIVKLLLRKGAIFNMKSKEHQTPKDVTENANIIEILRLIENIFNEAEKRNFGYVSTKLKNLNQTDILCVGNARNISEKTLPMVLLSNGEKKIAAAIFARLRN